MSPASAVETALAPPAAVARAIRRSGVRARVSRDAGLYVCNHFYFLLLRHLDGRALFLHLPRLPDAPTASEPGGPSLPLTDAMRAVRAALRFLAAGGSFPHDAMDPGGRADPDHGPRRTGEEAGGHGRTRERTHRDHAG